MFNIAFSDMVASGPAVVGSGGGRGPCRGCPFISPSVGLVPVSVDFRLHDSSVDELIKVRRANSCSGLTSRHGAVIMLRKSFCNSYTTVRVSRSLMKSMLLNLTFLSPLNFLPRNFSRPDLLYIKSTILDVHLEVVKVEHKIS